MKAKRRVCALLFSALMIWQGFMIVNAAGAPDAVTNGVEKVRTENVTPGSGTIGDSDISTQGGSGSGLTATGAPASGGSVQQNDGTRVHGIIQDAHIYVAGNNPVELTANHSIDRNTILQFEAKLNFKDTTLHKEDFTEITLPSLLQCDFADFEIMGKDDKPVANVEYDNVHNTIRITFNENIENRKNEDGELFFKMKMNTKMPSAGYELKIQDGGNSLISRQVTYEAGYTENPKSFFKDTVRKDGKVIQKTTVNGEDHYLVRYQVTFDAAQFEPDGNSYDELEFIDEFGENLSLFAPTTVEPELTGTDKEWYTPKIQRGVWKTIHGENKFEYWSLSGEGGPNGEPAKKRIDQVNYVNYNYDKERKIFKVALVNIGKGEGVVLDYYAEIAKDSLTKGAIYKNKVRVTSKGKPLKPLNPLNKSEVTKTFENNLENGGFVNQTENPPTPGNPPTPNNPSTPGNPSTPNNPPTPGNPPTPNTPPTPGNPPSPGVPPTTPPTPGQVLGARRYPEGQGGSEQEKPAVLGTRRGRGSTDTSDHSASDIHWLLFGFGTAGLFAICVGEMLGLERLLHRRKSRR